MWHASVFWLWPAMWHASVFWLWPAMWHASFGCGLPCDMRLSFGCGLPCDIRLLFGCGLPRSMRLSAGLGPVSVSDCTALPRSMPLSNLGDGGLQLDARSAVKRMQDQEPAVTDVGPAMFTTSQVLNLTACTDRGRKSDTTDSLWLQSLTLLFGFACCLSVNFRFKFNPVPTVAC